MIVNNSSSNKNFKLKEIQLLYAGQPSQTIIQNNGHLVLDNVHIYQNGIVTEGIIKNEANGTITIKNSVELHKNN